jgi:2-alkenal reductase
MMQKKIVRVIGLVALLAMLVACGEQRQSVAPTVDTEAIAATVVSQLQSELQEAVEPTATAEPQPTPSIVPVNENLPGVVEGNLQQTLVEVYGQTNPSVVFIIVPPTASGSGFVYSEDGYIVTNNHVVSGGENIEVVFASGERLAAEVVGTDVDSDLAVLKVGALPEGVSPLPLADGESLQVGQFVVAIGNPFGEAGSMSLGIVSGLGRSLPSQRSIGIGSTYSLPGVIQTDAPINPGNSGGPLLNLSGEVVGINSAIASFTGTNSGVGFAIPVQAVEQIVPVLIETGAYEYPYVGASFDDEVSLAEQELYGLTQTQGTYVVDVVPDGPAAAAGLQGANQETGRGGDLIIAIDDQPVNNFGDLNSYLTFHTSAGQSVELTVLRGEEEVVLSLTLGNRP